jgi:adenosylcobyric acid synthase
VFDGVLDARSLRAEPEQLPEPLRIAVIAYPRISNLDEFQALRNLPGVRLVWARSPADVIGADWVVLPGSKHTRGDLAWLRAQGLDAAIQAHAVAQRPVLGICGGLQMLGETLADPHGIDGGDRSDGGGEQGLGLLPLATIFEPEKFLNHTHAAFGALQGAWQALSGVRWQGYEIRHGRTVQTTITHATAHAMHEALHNTQGHAIGWQRGSVLGVYAHGLFESPEVMQALFGHTTRTLDAVFDGLADYLDTHFEPGALMRLLQPV